MKRLILAALLCTLLLGCAQAAPTREFRLTPTKETENDNLRCYPLDAADCRFFVFGDDLLLLRPDGEGAQLLLCRGKGLTAAARTEVHAGCGLSVGADGICCYDPQENRAFLLSPELSSLGFFRLPDCQGTPLLSGDGRIFYATGAALMELDTGTGLHRTIRLQEKAELTGFLKEEGLLICKENTQSLFIRTEDGTLAYTAPQVLATAGRSLVSTDCGGWDCLYMGKNMLPLPLGWRFLCFVPGRNGALVRRDDGSLAIYDLSTGKAIAELSWNGEGEIGLCQATEAGRIFFTSGGCLYRWEPQWQAKPDNRITITPLYTREQPDNKGLNQCRRRGAFLENRYGLRLLMGEDALGVKPAGVSLEPEYVPSAITGTLAGIESALGKLPAEFIRKLFSGCGRVYLCPVRRIQVEGEALPGLQCWSGRYCYLFIAATSQIRRGVIDAITPLAERQILMHSDALDRWEDWNPPGFSYSDTQWDETAFVSPACLESPEADRAGLFYAALEPGNRELFLSARLQNKLRALCQGLREAFPLEKETKRPWEQYLWKQ